MRRTAILHGDSLPGYDSLRPSELPTPPHDVFGRYAVELASLGHREYLSNPVYDHYLKIHKVLVGESGAHELVLIGDALVTERAPVYLSAAGWAYAEAGLALESESAVHRTELVSAAEDAWQRSLAAIQQLDQADIRLSDRSDMMHTALNLAYAPVMKAVISGDVTAATRERAFASTLAIAQTAGVQLQLAKRENDPDDVGEYVGFIHECNALLTLLHLNSPRYIPLPSSDRADSGYYHADQTHDITILNQHWGDIQKVIPVEIKGKASARDRSRYKALIVRGKMHLMLGTSNNPIETLDAYANVYEQSGSETDQKIIDNAAANMRYLLKLYQQGQGNGDIRTSSKTVFHDSRHVSHLYQAPPK